MQYDLNQLGDPERFQRLVNAILTARFGEDARLTPARGKDGGSDGEAGTDNPHMVFVWEARERLSSDPFIEPPRPGRYLFQAKYHRTGEQRLTDLRTTVVGEFRNELTNNILSRRDRRDVNYFFLVTNVPASYEAQRAVDDVRSKLLRDRDQLHADVWWGERITTALDWSPDLWQAYREIFPGGTPPMLDSVTRQDANGLARTIRLAVSQQYRRDKVVKFRQVELEDRLLDLFVDLDYRLWDEQGDSSPGTGRFRIRRLGGHQYIVDDFGGVQLRSVADSALNLLIDDENAVPRVLLEGGPGQGKSTITQMVAQIYREKLLGTNDCASRDKKWLQQCRLRLPVRLELRHFSEWLSDNESGTLDQYIGVEFGRSSGGATVAAGDVHQLVEHSAVILILDGLDEVGNDQLRDKVLGVILETVGRFEKDLQASLRVVLTTRPPAVSGRWGKLDGFTRVGLQPLSPSRIDDYVDRWLDTQISVRDERERIRESFNGRRHESHVDALARNPMQLSVLLQFIQLKDEAFPDRRADLYQEYFQKVIDRDVLKSRRLREYRELIEGLHAFLGFRLHGSTEAAQGRRSLSRGEIIEIAGSWLEGEGHDKSLAEVYFALGEERFGLIAAVSGEGHETNYGFEVQPIQEYFAASFISNRIPDGLAHEVFGLLVPREYWREVALFLAGLRRPNEKADLILRSRVADEDAERPWQQNGRAIILQLLREGVFGEPQYLQGDAMRLVVESAGPELLAFNRSPASLIDGLAEACRAHGDHEIHDRIYGFAEKLSKSNDVHLLALVHRLAASVLPKERYLKLVLGFAGTSQEARGLVRVTGAAQSNGLLSELGIHRSYWEGIALSDLAGLLWQVMGRSGDVSNIAYPVGLHERLIVQFAVSSPGSRRQTHPSVVLHEGRAAAIWQLDQNVQVIRAFGSGVERNEWESDAEAALRTPDLISDEVNSERLPTVLEQCVSDLVTQSGQIVAHLGRGPETEMRKCAEAYLGAIREHLEDPGLAAWVACKCGLGILQVRSGELREAFPKRLVDEVVEAIGALFGVDYRLLPELHLHSEGLPFEIPLAIRLERGSKPTPLHAVIGGLIKGTIGEEQREHCGWLTGIPLSMSTIRPLVECCRGHLPELLRFLGDRRVFRSLIRSRRLMVNDTRRVLRICRETVDNSTLNGAATVLMNASFSRVAAPELIVKILSAAPSSELVDRVFRVGRNEDAKVAEANRKLAQQVAHLILRAPTDHPFRTVNRAVAFLADTESPPSVPLFEARPDLISLARDNHVGV